MPRLPLIMPSNRDLNSDGMLKRLPGVSLEHLRVLSDQVGILQHSNLSVPDRTHGYSLDDNARALIAVCMYHNLFRDRSSAALMNTYLSFMARAFNPATGRFYNILSYDMKWAEDSISEDAHGRALWALGNLIKYSPDSEMVKFAGRLFRKGIPASSLMFHPRPLAFVILGLEGYWKYYTPGPEDRTLFAVLADRLSEKYCSHMSESWCWFEDKVTYANARLPHALFLAGQLVQDQRMIRYSLTALNWLIEVQNSANRECFSFIGNKGWWLRGSTKPQFDQQPIEAMALAQACLEVYRWQREEMWLHEACKCLEWFIGRNDLGHALIDQKTGACYDGLTPGGVNRNQGAESTLAWLISVLSIYEVSGYDALASAPARTKR